MSRVWVCPFTSGTPAPPGLRGGESRSSPKKPGDRAPHWPPRPEQSGACGSFALQPRPGGPGAQRTFPAGQWRSPLPALQYGRGVRLVGGGGLGGFPPTPAPGGGKEGTSTRVPSRGHGTVPSPGSGSLPLAAASAWPRRPARPGPEPPRPSPGGRPLPRPLPPPGRPRRSPARPRDPRAAAPPPEGPREGPSVSQAGSGAAGGRRAPAPARPLLLAFPAHLRHIGTFRANEQRRAQSPDGAPEPIAAAAAAVRPAPARPAAERLGPL
jgi:hypothetical protein